MIFKIKRCFKNYLLGVVSFGLFGAVHAQGHIRVIKTPLNESFKTNNHGQNAYETSGDLHLRACQLIKLVNIIKEISFLLGVQFTKDPNSFVNSMTYKDGERNLHFEFTQTSHTPPVSLFKDTRHFLYQLNQRLHHLIHIDSIKVDYQKYLAIKFWELYRLLTGIESPPPEKRNPSQADLKVTGIFILFFDLSERIQNPKEVLSYQELISEFIREEQHLIESFNQDFFLSLFE